MPKKVKQVLILLIILIFPSLVYILLSTGVHKHKSLPILGEKYVENGDTVYHTIADFEFINQYGEKVTNQEFEGKIVVVDFFFTTCGTICPNMTGNMARLQEWFRNDDDVMILSHTVNPEYDTVEILKAYSEEYGAMKGKWHMVTGDEQEIYEMGVKSYLIPTQEDPLAPGGFLHSEMFVLIDRSGHIRGFFDGTNTNQVQDLINGIKFLRLDKTENVQ